MVGISVLMVSTIGPLESFHLNVLRLFAGFWEYPKGAAADLLDGTLKLRHCNTFFTTRFAPWSLPRVGNGGGRTWYVTIGDALDDRSNVVRRVRVTRKTRPVARVSYDPDPGHPTPRR